MSACTKQMHNALQGLKQAIIYPNLLKVYEQTNAENAERLKSHLESADIVFIHDPQPAALIHSFPNRKNKWVWRCHIDASNPARMFWKYLRHSIVRYDGASFLWSISYNPFRIPFFSYRLA